MISLLPLDSRSDSRPEPRSQVCDPRSQVALGNESLLAVALPQLSPRIAPQQRCHAWTPLMRRRIPPMLWDGHQPALDGVIM